MADTTSGARKGGAETGEEVVAALRPDGDPEEFWKAVEANLAAGRVRMLFVADELPGELVRIIEFLNEQMNPAEVLGVELRQYVGGGQIVYIPRVVGRTSIAVATKSPRLTQQWNEQSFLDAARDRRPPDEVALIERLLEHVHTKGDRLSWGTGATPGVSGWYSVAGQSSAVWNINVNSDTPSARAYVYLYLGDLAKELSAETIEQAAKVLERVSAIAPKIADARANDWNRYPSVYLQDIAHADADIATIFQAIDILTQSV